MVGRPENKERLKNSVINAKNADAVHMIIYNIKLSESSDTKMGHVVDYKSGRGKSFKQNKKEYYDTENYKKGNK